MAYGVAQPAFTGAKGQRFDINDARRQERR